MSETEQEVEATPAAETKAEELGVDVAEVAPGSGAEGRVLVSDVEEHAETTEGDGEDIQERTEAAIQSAGQPIPDDQAPGYGDEATKDSSDIEGSDDARRVHPDMGGYQYQGDDSAAQVNDAEADA